MVYRYQEWEDGVHNFDDHLILSLHLCLSLRNGIQVKPHYSVYFVLT
jgi:hypothetical protein